jgi:hypothetical protein
MTLLNPRRQPSTIAARRPGLTPRLLAPWALSLTCLAAVATSLAWSPPAQANDRVVTNVQRSTAQQVASNGVPLSELAANAPDTYTVKGGDTLWDVSKIFLKSPWRWPELWGMNLEQIQNPHLIYPGQTLMLLRSDGRARLALADQVGNADRSVRLAPRVRSGEAQEPIAAVSMSLIAPFLQEMGVFNVDELAQAPRIVAAPDERVLMGRGDVAYALGDIGAIRDWTVFRSATPLKDPKTQELLGYEARLLGAAQYTRPGELRTVQGKTEIVPATFTINHARSEIRAGDRLLPQVASNLSNFVPRAPTKPLSGQVVSVYGDGLIAGQNQIVAINRGAGDGLERGHVLSVLRDGRTLVDRTGPDGKALALKLPDERHGLMVVFRVFDRVSYALLLNTQLPVRAGDHFDMP